MESSISLSVPATLAHKDLILRAVEVAARQTQSALLPGTDRRELDDPFTAELVSALSELVNNIVLHGHASDGGVMRFELTSGDGYVEVEIRESGDSFDIAQVTAPDLEALPESGMGLFIVRSFVDELWYEPGQPNVWNLVKYRSRAAEQARNRELRANAASGIDSEPTADSTISSSPAQPRLRVALP